MSLFTCRELDNCDIFKCIHWKWINYKHLKVFIKNSLYFLHSAFASFYVFTVSLCYCCEICNKSNTSCSFCWHLCILYVKEFFYHLKETLNCRGNNVLSMELWLKWTKKMCNVCVFLSVIQVIVY